MWRADSLEKIWCWERLKARDGDDGGWDGWIASPTQRTQVSASFGKWWRTGKPGVLQSMGSKESDMSSKEWLNNNFCCCCWFVCFCFLFFVASFLIFGHFYLMSPAKGECWRVWARTFLLKIEVDGLWAKTLRNSGNISRLYFNWTCYWIHKRQKISSSRHVYCICKVMCFFFLIYVNVL